jgi:hypothetical protein
MAMIKGKNQHVMPDESGWTVVDESNQQVIRHFNTREEAITYATQQASGNESEVLIHTTSSATATLSTVSLPQQEVLPDQAHASAPDSINPNDQADSDFDPLLGYDEYYFEL